MAADEDVFEVVRARLRDRAPLQYNIWMMLGRGMARTVDELARVLWYPAEPPAKRQLCQFRVGAFVGHLNKKHLQQHDRVIKPGALRGTYQLYVLSTWELEQAAQRLALIRAAQAAGRPIPSFLPRGFASPAVKRGRKKTKPVKRPAGAV